MKTYFLAIPALLASTALVHAGGIDRSGQSINALFENGRYAEFSFGHISPDTSGTSAPADPHTATLYTAGGDAVPRNDDTPRAPALCRSARAACRPPTA